MVAEVDTDSHLNLISAKYFERIKNEGSITFLNEQPTEYSGLGSSLRSEYPPVILSIQIGHCIIKARFIVSKELKSSPVFIGSDFLVKNEISVAPHKDGWWWLHVGPIDDPLGMIPVQVSNQLTLSSVHEVDFAPFEVKRVRVIPPKQANTLRTSSKEHELLSSSPFKLESDQENEDDDIWVRNCTPICTRLLPGVPLAMIKEVPNISQISEKTEEPDHDPRPGAEPVPPDSEFLLNEDVENDLEPGIQFKKVIDKEEELDFIRKHPDIPDDHKLELIRFLEKYPELSSGVEFSKKHFPREA